MISNELFLKTYNEYDHVMNIALFRYTRFFTRDEIKEIKQNAVFDSLRKSDNGYPLGIVIRNRTMWTAFKFIKNKTKTSKEQAVSNAFFEKVQSKPSFEDVISDMDSIDVFPDILKKRFIERKTLKELGQEYGCSHECIRSYIKELVQKCL